MTKAFQRGEKCRNDTKQKRGGGEQKDNHDEEHLAKKLINK